MDNNKSRKSIYLTEKEWNFIQKRAEEYNCSNTEVIRRLIYDSLFLSQRIKKDEKLKEKYNGYREILDDALSYLSTQMEEDE